MVQKRKNHFIVFLSIILILSLFSESSGARLKDIAFFQGVRNNQLLGYGLVVGLNGTGDSTNAEFTIRSIVNMLERMGINTPRERVTQIRLKNVAGGHGHRKPPSFLQVGQSDRRSGFVSGGCHQPGGGNLAHEPPRRVRTGRSTPWPKGPIVTGGFAVSGASGSSVQKNHPTVGSISKGALIEQEIPLSLEGKKELALTLFQPDFTTAEKVKEVINRTMGGPFSKCLDSGTVQIAIPTSFQDRVPEWMAALERLEVVPDSVAKVILNEKTGTVVLGEKVRISTVAVAHGNLSIQIKEKFNVSQPLPLRPRESHGHAGNRRFPRKRGPDPSSPPEGPRWSPRIPASP